MPARNPSFHRIVLQLAFMLLASVSQAQVMYRILKNTPTTLSNGRDVVLAHDDCYPLISLEESGSILKLKFSQNSFYVPRSACSIVPQSGISAAITGYNEEQARELPRTRQYEEEQAKRSRTSSTTSSSSQPTSSSPAPVPQPTNVTVEPLYTWDVKVYIGRKYWATENKYEVYSSLATEVQAKTRSEAERIAADKRYTTKSALFGSQITVEPAGTFGAKFRVYNCEATRQ